MKKILAVGHSFVLAQNRDVLRYLQAQGKCEITVLAPRFFHGDLRDIHMEEEPVGSPLKVVPIDCYGTRSIHFFAYNIFQIENILKKEKFDAIYLWEEAYIVSGFTLAHVFNKFKIPYFIYSCQNIFKKYPWPFSYLEHKVYSHAQRLFACGQGVKDVFLQKGFASDVVPFFVSLDRFKPMTEAAKTKSLSELGLSGEITVGFMGRLVEEKGLNIFTETLDRIASKNKCNIIVIGSGPLESKLKLWASTKKNTAILALKHHEVPSVLAVIDILLCPSQTKANWKEQFGRMIVEAFASGVAVLGSSSGEIPHVIEDAGVVLGEKQVSEWVRAVDDIIQNSEKRAACVERGLRRAKIYSVESVAELLFASVARSLKWE